MISAFSTRPLYSSASNGVQRSNTSSISSDTPAKAMPNKEAPSMTPEKQLELLTRETPRSGQPIIRSTNFSDKENWPNSGNSSRLRRVRPTLTQVLNTVGPLKRISARRSRAKTRPNCKRTVFEGHGEIKKPVKKIRVPPSTTVTLYTGLNCVLLEKAAVAIAKNDKLPSSLRYKGTDFEGYHEADIFGGRSYLTKSRRTYVGGELIPNLVLYPPTLGMRISNDSVTTQVPTNLKQLLSEHTGEDCHWSACTIIRP